MDSPLNIGDTTTSSILNKLSDTHLAAGISSSTYSATYAGTKYIQLNVAVPKSPPSATSGQPLIVLRRILDSYVNVTQLLDILVKINAWSKPQLTQYVANEILASPQNASGSKHRYNDLQAHENALVRGVWVPYDKAVSLSLKFDLYELVKKLFLIDVHDFDKLPGAQKRILDDTPNPEVGSPSKKQKTDASSPADSRVTALSLQNSNFPFTLPPVVEKDAALAAEIKLRFTEVFKKDENGGKISFDEIKAVFLSILAKNKPNNPFEQLSFTDVSLDDSGKTALHFAATLGSENLVAAFIKLDLCSPIRGAANGQSPLISAIQVTNSMEKGNFKTLLDQWLWPGVWLFDLNHQSFLHYLILQLKKSLKSSKYYFVKVLEWIFADPEKRRLKKFLTTILNSKDHNHNTPLHLAAENEHKWFVWILLELRADVDVDNKAGVKPSSFDIISEPATLLTEEDLYLAELIKANIQFLGKADDVPEEINGGVIKSEPLGLLSNKIFQSIQDLLANTNTEYEGIINAKKAQISELNKELHDSVLVTANNRFVHKKILEKLSHLDNIKLQMANINDKYDILKKEVPDYEEDATGDIKFDADEPYIIEPIYSKLSKNEEVDKAAIDVAALPPAAVLQARIDAYKYVNDKLSQQLASLSDYTELTSKFKKVVSFCTGVDINEVDELLDGLLEAVESQQ